MFWRLTKDERGVSAVIIAISLVGILGALVLSLDAGNIWTSKRAMVTATDSAALVGARMVGLSTTTVGTNVPCSAAVQAAVVAQMTSNSPTATLDSCTVFNNTVAHTGYITVAGRKTVQVGFARVLGVGDQSAFSSSTVKFGPGPTPKGLRPITFCKDNPLVKNFFIVLNNNNDYTGTYTFQTSAGGTVSSSYNNLPIADPIDYEYYVAIPPDGQTHVVSKFYLNKVFGAGNPAVAGQCTGSSSGNWGFVDFNGGSNSTPELGGWFLNGFQEHEVAVNDCDPTTPGNQTCPLNPGVNGNSLTSYLDQIKGVPFAIPLYDTIGCGGGNNGCFNVWGFLGVTLRTYVVVGNALTRYYGFELSTIQTSGSCCTAGATWTGVLGSDICSVDHDPVAVATRCS
jgi:hypothetical protein